MVEEVVKNIGAMLREWGVIYKAVVHMFLIHGIKIWVVMGDMLKVI